MDTLKKSKDKCISGVCGGIAEYINFDPTLVRAIYAMVTLMTVFPGIVLYLILAFVMPDAE